MWTEYDALIAEIKSVPPEQRQKAATDMNFVQTAFNKLDERLAQLPESDRHAVMAVLASRLARVLYSVHFRVEAMIMERDFNAAVGGDALADIVGNHADRQRALANFYHRQ